MLVESDGDGQDSSQYCSVPAKNSLFPSLQLCVLCVFARGLHEKRDVCLHSLLCRPRMGAKNKRIGVPPQPCSSLANIPERKRTYAVQRLWAGEYLCIRFPCVPLCPLWYYNATVLGIHIVQHDILSIVIHQHAIGLGQWQGTRVYHRRNDDFMCHSLLVALRIKKRFALKK